MTAPLSDDPFGVGPLKNKNNVIYSIGPDGKDDGAQPIPPAPHVKGEDKGDVLAPSF